MVDKYAKSCTTKVQNPSRHLQTSVILSFIQSNVHKANATVSVTISLEEAKQPFGHSHTV